MADLEKLLRVSDIDYDSIRNNLIDFLQQQEQFRDYNFLGANFSVLINLLSYNTYYKAFYLNSIFSELFLGSARRRSSVVSRAKELGYFPTSATSAYAVANIVATDTGANTEDHINLGLYQLQLTAGTNNNLYYFTTKDAITLRKTATRTFGAIGITIVQGIPYRDVFTVNENTNSVTLANRSIDASSVKVRNVTVDGDLVDIYYRIRTASDVIEINEESPVFWIAEDVNEHYTVYFGDGITLGKKPAIDSRIIIDYLLVDEDGAIGVESGTNFTVVRSPIALNYNITATTPIVAGNSKESTESIRQTAPLVYSAQNRAVTTNDYVGIVKSRWPQFRSIRVWGGEENSPPAYGDVFIAIINVGNEPLTSSVKTAIEKELRKFYSVAGITPNAIDGMFLDINVSGNVLYDSNATTLSPGEIKTVCENSIRAYSQNNLETFDAPFRYTNLTTTVNMAETSVISNRLDITLAQEANVSELEVSNLNFDNEIIHGSLRSTTFSYRGVDNSWMADENGHVAIKATIDGNTVTLDSNIGSIDYKTGLVVISAIDGISDNSKVIISVTPINHYGDLISRHNRALKINNINIESVEE